MYNITSPLPQFFDGAGSSLDNGYIYIGASGSNPETTPITVYWDKAGTQPAAQPIRTVNGYIARNGKAAKIWTSANDFSIVVRESNGTLVYSELSATSVLTLVDQLAATNGASLIGFIRSATGAIARTVLDVLRSDVRVNAAKDFGADPTGVANSTTALLNFYNHCIATVQDGYIPSGVYLVTPGVLKFDCNQTNKSFPNIHTDKGVEFKVDPATSAGVNTPVLEWTNGTAMSSSTYGWQGGSHGGLTIRDATGHTAADRCGISLKGLKDLKFTGRVVGIGLRSDLIRVPQALYGGANPDPYAVSDLKYDFFEANDCVGYAVNNLNYVGQDSWIGNGVRAIGGGGGIYGSGSGCIYGQLTVGNCSGRAYDDGTQSGAPGGSPQRNYITIAEIDNVQYGFRFNKTSNTIMLGLRIIHRFNVSPNTSGLYWPRKALDFTAGTDPNVNNTTLQVFHRIEGGGVLANLGTFCDFNSSANISGLEIDVDYADNGSLGVTDSLLFSNIPTTATIYAHKRTKPLIDSRDKGVSFAIGSSSTSIPNGGLSAIAFPTQRFSVYTSPYNTGTSTYTARRRGLHFVNVALPTTVAVGTRIRMHLTVNGASRYCETTSYQANVGNQVHQLNGFVVLSAGDTLQAYADNNSGGAITCTPQQSDDVRFVVSEM